MDGTQVGRDAARVPVPRSLFTVHHGDARRLDTLLGPYSPSADPLLTCTITSPPYGQMKDYGHPDQIGWGQSHDDYLVELRHIFGLIGRHTRDDGCMWVIADTFRPEESNGSLRRLEPLPFQLAAEAEDAGWTFRDVIVWRKDKTLPWSGRGRLRNAFEYVLLFVKGEKFKYYIDRIRDPVDLEEWWVKWPERYNPQGKVPDNVWEIPIPLQGSWASSAVQHACPLPPDLVERLILLSSDPGDVVFDPFSGTGVTVAEAERLGRSGVGIELVKKHVSAFHSLVRPEILNRGGEEEVSKRQDQADWLRKAILNLRIVKYPKVLLQMLKQKHPDAPRPLLAVVIGSINTRRLPAHPHKLADARTLFVVQGNERVRSGLERELKDLSLRRPASKFGIAGDISVIDEGRLTRAVEQKRLYFYLNGRTYASAGRSNTDGLPQIAEEHAEDKYPPIAANVRVSEKPRALSAV